MSVQLTTSSPVTRRRAALLAGVVAAVALAIPVLGTPDQVLANTPPCGNLAHSTGAGTGQFPCSGGNIGKYSMLCIGVLHSGPGIGYANHGTATGTNIFLYQVKDNGTAVQGGCGGPTTNRWFLSSNGWASRSITTASF